MIAVRPGYEAVGGWVTATPAIVVTVLRKRADVPAAERLPDTLDGVPVDVRQASRLEALRASDPALFVRVAAQLEPEQQLARFDSERLVQPAGLVRCRRRSPYAPRSRDCPTRRLRAFR